LGPALAAVRETTFAIILTDYSLPGRNGIELLRALREKDDETPVVLMTGLGDEFVAVAALQQGETVVKLLPPQDKREVAVSGLVSLQVPAEVHCLLQVIVHSGSITHLRHCLECINK